MIIEYKEGFDPVMNAPCVVAGMPNDVYHGSDAISKSGLDKIDKTPAHYKYGEFSGSKAMELGTALHAAILEPDVFKEQFLMLPDVKDRRASEYKQAAKSMGAGNVLVGKECAQVDGMICAINANFKAAQLLNGDKGWRELSVFAHDPETGVLCRCRFDFLGQDENGYYAVDLKTTADAGDSGFLAFQNSIAKRRYHVQDAFYGDVLNWATGIELQRFWFAAVESKAPHGVVCRFLGEDSVYAGRTEYRANLNTYAECKSTDTWPCYDQPQIDDEAEISLPDWYWRQLESNEVDEIF